MTPHLLTLLFDNLTLNFSPRISGCYCGVEALATSTGLLLSQQKYVIDLLSKHNMLDSKHVSPPLEVGTSLTAHDGTTLVSATTYCQVVAGLQHLRMTRPDISFALNKLSQFMHAPFEHHWGVIKRLFHYLNGMISLGIQLLVDTPQTLHGFSYLDWVGNPDDCTSIGAFLIFLGVNRISWISTKECIVARSSIKAKYCAITATFAKLQWVKSLLSKYFVPMQSPLILFSDNLGATYIFANPVFHYNMKHLAINYHLFMTWFNRLSYMLFMS